MSLAMIERDDIRQTDNKHRTHEHLLFGPSTVDRGWYTIGPFGAIISDAVVESYALQSIFDL